MARRFVTHVPPPVLVRPLTKNALKFVKHPSGNTLSDKKPTPWPDDQFTARRVKDGDIEIVKPDAAEAKQADAKPKPKPAASEPHAPRRPTAD